ncbi:Alkylated DNA repair dioxygenase AlkB [Lutibacter oricola]|uniref:Alkylated DNA repair dioxygenase AlkB n=1 Tax=Lutibacter oricola TaxID=762486 RepID=A0A1H3DP96_9FLAO|nr:alpha-ketoglutarate-dependent dioxygenase AlkB [Lutibacter oricola]SDX67479.1 Alkylated DNA repair dioxygenase AlkB [Lutibacter oricola]
MDLFNTDIFQNRLPFDGEVINYGLVLNTKQCQQYLEYFLNANFWKQDELIMFGKHITTSRKIAWFGDANFEYFYSGTKKIALEWTPEILELKQLVQEKTGAKFNSCLINLYHNGNEGLGWHTDNEKELGKNPIIASLSFGATRKFSLKHIANKQKVDLLLETGNLLVMQGSTQENWIHSVPKSKKIIHPRINLTFRYIRHNLL